MLSIHSLAALILAASAPLAAQQLVAIPAAENRIQAIPVAPGSHGANRASSGARSAYVQPTEKIIPHFATGAGWETEVVLVNLGTATLPFEQYFYDTAGASLPVTFRTIPDGNLITTAAASGSLVAGGMVSIRLFDQGGGLQTGWSYISYDATAARIGGYAIFRQRVAGRPDFEALVPLSAFDDDIFVLPFDNMNGFVTAMAILNPGVNYTTTVTATVLDRNANQTATYSLPLSPGQQRSFTLPDLFPATRNTIGTIVFEGTTNRLGALGFRFNSGGAFATIPVLNWAGMFQ